MKSYHSSVKQARQLVQESSLSLEEAWRQLGQTIINKDDTDCAALQGEMQSLCFDIQAAKEQKAENAALAGRIQSITARRAELAKLMAEIPNKLRQKEEDATPIYIRAGEITLETQGHHPPDEPALRSLLTKTAAVSEAYENARAAMTQGDEKKGLFKGIGAKISGAAGSMVAMRRQKELQRQLLALGMALLQEGKSSFLPNLQLGTTLTEYQELQTAKKMLEDELEEAKSESRLLLQQLEEENADAHPMRRADELAMHSHTLTKEIETKLVILGKQYYQLSLKNEKGTPGTPGELVQQIENLTETIANQEKQIERLEAAIQIEKLENRRKDIAKKVESIQKQIALKQQEIVTLTLEADKAEEEIARLVRIRGPLNSLSK